MAGSTRPSAPVPGGEVPPARKPQRYPFIDILRGLAVVFMIETHTVNALLLPRVDGGMLRSALVFFNGLVAPAFLFCAGLGFAISLWRRAAGLRPGRSLAVSLVKKCLFIMLVGYSMHAPVFSLRGLLEAPVAVRDGFFQVDILQVIAVSLLLMLGVALLFRTPGARIGGAGVLGTAVILAGTLAGGTSLFASWGEGLPVWLSSYFSHDVSLFTIVPWAAYPAAGFIAGLVFMRGAEKGEEVRTIGRAALTAAAALMTATVLATSTSGYYPGDSFWYWSAEYVVIRLAAVVLIMCAVWWGVRRGPGPVARAVGLFGRESLPVYYYRLLIVYGRDFEWSFVRLFPEGMGAAACFGMAVGLTLLMYAFARAWSSAKKRYPRGSLLAVRGMVAGAVVTFLLS